MTEEQLKAIKYYTSSGGFLFCQMYADASEDMRKSDDRLQTAKKKIEILLSMMEPIGQKMKFYRYWNFDLLPTKILYLNRMKKTDEIITEYWSDIKGNPFKDNSFISVCSENEEENEIFKHMNIIWDITAHKSVKGVDIHEHTNMPIKSEWLLSPDTEYVISDWIKRDDGKIVLKINAK